MPKQLLWGAAVAVAALVASPPSAAAQQAYGRGFGARIGADLENDNVLLGGHVNLGFLTPPIRFQPNAAIGLGGDDDTFGVNVEFQYFTSPGMAFEPYVGGGIGFLTGGGEDGAVLDGVVGVEADVSSKLDWFAEGRLLIGDEIHPRIETGFTFLSF
jgi:opacity protein-like surface antigen